MKKRSIKYRVSYHITLDITVQRKKIGYKEKKREKEKKTDYQYNIYRCIHMYK